MVEVHVLNLDILNSIYSLKRQKDKCKFPSETRRSIDFKNIHDNIAESLMRAEFGGQNIIQIRLCTRGRYFYLKILLSVI